MADFMKIQYENRRLKQSVIANQLGYSTSTLQRYRNDINMLSPYRIKPHITIKRTKKTSNTNFDNNSHPDSDVKRLRLTSNNLKPTWNKSVKNMKSKLNGGANVEINGHV